MGLGVGRTGPCVGPGGGEGSADSGEDVEAQEVGQVVERGLQTLALGTGGG